MRSSYSGSVIGPKTSTWTLPRMFMPAPWITRTLGIVPSVGTGMVGILPPARRAVAVAEHGDPVQHGGRGARPRANGHPAGVKVRAGGLEAAVLSQTRRAEHALAEQARRGHPVPA